MGEGGAVEEARWMVGAAAVVPVWIRAMTLPRPLLLATSCLIGGEQCGAIARGIVGEGGRGGTHALLTFVVRSLPTRPREDGIFQGGSAF